MRVGARVANRGLDYRDNLSGTTRPYTMPLGPALTLGADFFPGALLTNDALANVGITGSASHSLFLTSNGPNGVSFPTRETSWELGARARLPLGEGEIAGVATIGQHGFSVEPSHPRDGSPDIASVLYTHLRIGADGRAQLGRFSLRAGASWLAVLDPGEIAGVAWYPGTSAQGIAGSVGAGFELGLGFEIRLDLDARFYFLDFHPNADDPEAVGGALDHYVAGHLTVAWRPDRL